MSRRTIVWGLGLAGALLGLGARRAATEESVPQSTAAPFAVIELFTSEGCSSCPPADRLLGTYAALAEHENQLLFPLAFHVDYWDHLGWKDPYGNAAWSKRQSLYAGAFESRYTPQMIVNGGEPFVGSDAKQAKRVIDAALHTPATLRVEGRCEVWHGFEQPLQVRWNLKPAASHTIVNVALVESGLESRVERGENAGRTLVHDAVVRAMESSAASAEGQGTMTLSVPSDVRLEHAAVVLYAQDSKTHRILGATRIPLPSTIP